MAFWNGSPQWDLEKDVPDLQGKVIVVTGGNVGLGFATIQHLVRHGAKVYMGARSEAKAKAAIAKLDLSSGKGSVEWLELNLSDPRDAKRAGERFLEKEQRLDVLVNNAALSVVPYSKIADGCHGDKPYQPICFHEHAVAPHGEDSERRWCRCPHR